MNLIAGNLNGKLKAAPVRSTLLHHQELRSDQKMPADSINHRTAPPGEELPGEISRDPQTVRNAVCDSSHYPAAVIHKICGQLCGKQRKNYPGCSSELGLHRCQALLGFLFLYVKSNTYTIQTVTTTSSLSTAHILSKTVDNFYPVRPLSSDILSEIQSDCGN